MTLQRRQAWDRFFLLFGIRRFLITFAVCCNIYVAAAAHEWCSASFCSLLSLPRSPFHIQFLLLALSAISSLSHIPFRYPLRTSIPLQWRKSSPPAVFQRAFLLALASSDCPRLSKLAVLICGSLHLLSISSAWDIISSILFLAVFIAAVCTSIPLAAPNPSE